MFDGDNIFAQLFRYFMHIQYSGLSFLKCIEIRNAAKKKVKEFLHKKMSYKYMTSVGNTIRNCTQ